MASSIRAGMWLPAHRGVPATARTVVAFVADGLGMASAVRTAAVMVVGELVTNAVVHAGLPSYLSVRPGPNRQLDVAVHDADPRLPVWRVDMEEPSGLGLRLVSALAERWGVDRGPVPGKTVWATIGPAPATTGWWTALRQPGEGSGLTWSTGPACPR